jgi:hypothetical protein
LTTFLIGAALPASCNANTPGSAVSRRANQQIQTRTASQVTPRRDVSPAPGLVGVLSTTDRILMLHILDGQAFHQTPGQPKSDGRVQKIPFDVAKAILPQSYSISSKDDPQYRQAKHPTKIGRKSKGQDILNTEGKYDWLNAHAIYLLLPAPLQRGKTYTISVKGPFKSRTAKNAHV